MGAGENGGGGGGDAPPGQPFDADLSGVYLPSERGCTTRVLPRFSTYLVWPFYPPRKTCISISCEGGLCEPSTAGVFRRVTETVES